VTLVVKEFRYTKGDQDWNNKYNAHDKHSIFKDSHGHPLIRIEVKFFRVFLVVFLLLIITQPNKELLTTVVKYHVLRVG
jgi:hypothetical protein